MEQNKRPHSREKNILSGSAHVGKGQQMGNGPVGGIPTGGSGNRAGGQRGGGSGLLSLLAIFFMLPKKLRGIVLVLVVIAAALYFFSGGLGGGDYSAPQTPTQQITAPSTPSTPSNSGSAVDLTVSSEARPKRVVPLGNGKDTVTVMIYMCGTDLESKYGMATKDLQEMINATISDKVNVIVETGGCKAWKNGTMSSSVNQIYRVVSGGIRLLEDNVGNAAMTSPANLTNFIQYCNKNYPADRNILIFWDHGGGSITGYGYDEKYPSAGSMTLTGINDALSDAGCVFDWIGFDACLMATLETDLVCNNYADYMIASEETEPGTGWHYTGWLTQLSKNTSIPTVELAQTIIDDFVSNSGRGEQVTLSVVDLAELQGTVPDKFRDFAASTSQLIQSGDYQVVSDARARATQYAKSSKINQVDLVDLAIRIGTPEAADLSMALQNCVKYKSGTIARSNGISIYFPYESLNSMKGAVSTYNSLGMDEEYTKCIQSFASLEYGGQISASSTQQTSASVGGADLLGSLLQAYAGSSSSPVGSLLGSYAGASGGSSAGSAVNMADMLSLLSGFSGRSMPQQYDWVDTQLVADSAETIAKNFVDPARITASKKDGYKVLSLTEDEWSLIQTVELNVFVDDGDGYIDLGLDNTFDWYGDDLLLDYDGTWLTVDGNVAAYYMVSDVEHSDGSYTTVGVIPALLNGEPVRLQVVYDTQYPTGVITGALPLYEGGETDAIAKCDVELTKGDEIEFLCDYYDYDGTYSSSYTLGSSFTVGDKAPVLGNMRIDTTDVRVAYRLTDIYGNHFWLPVD